MSGSKKRSTGAHATARAASPRAIALGLTAVLVLVHADVFRLGFFADDFHFLDVARRAGLGDLLLGRVGIYPWYRPLSRELFFLALVPAGAAGAFIAHAAGLAALACATWAVFRLGERFAPRGGALVAALLFAASGVGKFLAGWASGFQDLLALALTLHAVLALDDGRRGRALALAFLAAFAKETGFLAFALLGLHQVTLASSRREIRSWRTWLGLAATGALALAVHVGVRATWPRVASSAIAHTPGRELLAAVGDVLAWVVPHGAGPTTSAIAGALAAGLVAGGILHLYARTRANGAGAQAAPGAGVFLAGAIVLGLLPLVAAALSPLGRPHAYYAFGALPWLLLALARWTDRLPERALVIGAIVAAQAWSLAYRPPDLERAAAWDFRRWDWPEAERLSAVAARFTEDVRRELATRPDSAVVLYHSLPYGCMVQTEDGPATREALRDPTASAYYLNDAPLDVAGRRLVILRFDTARHGLVREERSMLSLQQAMAALVANLPRPARVWSEWVPPDDHDRFEVAYTRAGAWLVARGPDAYVASLAEGGLDSTSAELDARLAAALPGGDAVFRSTWEAVLREPRSAARHVAFADTLLARGVRFSGEAELRLVVALDAGRLSEALRLGRMLAQDGAREPAREELTRASRATDPTIRNAARQALLELDRAHATSAHP